MHRYEISQVCIKFIVTYEIHLVTRLNYISININSLLKYHHNIIMQYIRVFKYLHLMNYDLIYYILINFKNVLCRQFKLNIN